MPLARLDQPFDHPDWIFEVKYDGFRALAHINKGSCQLVSRNRNAFKTFPTLAASIGQAIPGEAVLDGEIVCLGQDGKPRFYDVMRRRSPQVFYAFDILWHNGQDLRPQPLIERKRILKRLVRPPVLFADHVAGAGVALFDLVCREDLEGIVAKLKTGKYDPAATSWLKIKNPIYSQMEGRKELFEKRTPRQRASSTGPAVHAGNSGARPQSQTDWSRFRFGTKGEL